MRPLPTAEQVRGLLDYDPLAGVFRWKVSGRGGKSQAGATAGRIDSVGYVTIVVAGCRVRGHRLAWLVTHGGWPTEIDHVDGDRTNNRIANLRLTTRSQNNANSRRRPCASGYKGVQPKGRRYKAKITKGSKQIYLGTFDSPEEAHAAYAAAARLHFGEFARLS